MKLSVVLALVCLAAGCGDDVDLSGMYLVTYHTQNDSDCELEGETVDEPPYFRIEKDEIFGQEYFAYSECDSAEESSCTGLGLFGISFTVPIDNGWKGESSQASGFGDPCVLTYSETRAVFQEDDSLRVEVRAWSEEVTVSEADCGYELAEDRGKSMPCENFEILAGTEVAGE